MSPAAADAAQPSLLALLLPALIFGGVSFTLNIVNKTAFSIYRWERMILLSVLGNLTTVLLLRTAHAVGVVSLRPVSRTTLRALLPLAVLGCGNQVAGFIGMHRVSLPMYLVLRRLTTLVTLLLEWLMQGKRAPARQQAAIGVMMAGTLVAGWNDLSSSLFGYCFVLAQNAISAANFVVMNKAKADQGDALTRWEMVHFNALASLPILAAPLTLSGELVGLGGFEGWQDPLFCVTFVFICCCTLVYQIAAVTCATRLSALTASITGNCKDLLSTLVGFVLFPDSNISAAGALGFAMSFIGVWAFGFFKLQDQRNAETQQPSVDKAKAE